MYILKRLFYGLLVIGLIIISKCISAQTSGRNIHLIPEPVSVKRGNSTISLTGGYTIHAGNTKLRKLLPVISDEIFKLTGIKYNPDEGRGLSINLKINPELKGESYHLEVTNNIELEGSTYDAVAEGSVTLLQLIDRRNRIPIIEIKDSALFDYRGLEVDLARSWHDVKNLEQIITLCRWYKIKYLHLHFTDDQSFTFPSKKYPLLPTKDRHYTWDQLVELDNYAAERGVVIIPEIEGPSHASSFIKAMPELFGITDWRKNSYTLNMGKEEVYKALDNIIGEMAEIFHESPYIHIGSDEVFAEGMEKDPGVEKYMYLHGLHSPEELYQHYIVRVNDIVKKYGKQAIVWSGFQKDNAVKIPTDVLVMEYETSNYPPQDLVNDGYRIVNATFKPLYVVNNQRWDPAYIYQYWNAFKWEMPSNIPGRDKGLNILPTSQVAGGSMSSWEQSERKEIPSLRRRLAAMSERLWNPNQRNVTLFMRDLVQTDEKFGRLLSPVVLSEKGRTYPGSYDGNFDEMFWFDSAITIKLRSVLPGITMHYTSDGSYPVFNSPQYKLPLTFSGNIQFRVQAYDHSGNPIGFSINNSYKLHPVEAVVKGIRKRKDMKPNSWEKAKFDDSVTIAFSSKVGNHIKYGIDQPPSSLKSALYTKPITINRSASVTGQVYDAQEKPVGLPFRQEFVKVEKEVSLTTGKPVKSSSDVIDPRLAKLVVDGEITDEEYWSGKVNSWIEIDLKKIEKIGRLKVYTFWDDSRYYQYIIEVSGDGTRWQKVVDFSRNKTIATSKGYIHDISPVNARYIKITMLFNSANSSMHLVELNAFGSANKSE